MAINFYLKLDGISGEAPDPYKDAITVLSYSFGVEHTAPKPGTPTPKPSVSELSFFKNEDKSSPALLRACLAGTAINKGVLSAYKAGSDSPTVPLLQLTFQGVHITSVQESGSSEVPTESVSFAFTVLNYSYTVQDGTGTAVGPPITVNYNITTNKVT
jgi:type VI secretion system Hcp family effector